MSSTEQIIKQTHKWVMDVVIGCNFCPFAASVVKQDKIYYRTEESTSLEKALTAVLQEAARLDTDAAIETTLIIFPTAYSSFPDYLELVSLAEKLLKKNKYEGVYQLASFHPRYKFAGSDEADPANYTNRSLYPMLHLLREESIEKALQHYKYPEAIPERNIAFAKEKGLASMKILREACF
jgi:uncharacterized protein